MNIVLGPASELHRGVHSALVEEPPPGVEFVGAPHRHDFAFDAPGRRDPFVDFSIAEVVHYEAPRDAVAGVHSANLPVGGDLPWIADVDCLATALRYGRPFIRGSPRLPSPRDVGDDAIRKRGRRMIRYYLDDRCKAVLFWTDHARRTAYDYVAGEALLADDDLDRFGAKLEVVHPTVRPGPLRLRDRGVTVLYMGRTYEDKGGPLAAEIFAALADLPARLVWVGQAPRKSDPRLRHVEFHGTIARDRYLELLGGVDIFLSPSEHESYGMGLVEAAAHGAALVTTRGRGMEHIEELFVDGEHALLTDNSLPCEARLASVLQHVRTLVAGPELRRRMQEANRKLVAEGRLALARRNRKLSASYARLAEPAERRSRPTSFSATLSAAAIRRSYRSYAGGVPSRVLVR